MFRRQKMKLNKVLEVVAAHEVSVHVRSTLSHSSVLPPAQANAHERVVVFEKLNETSSCEVKLIVCASTEMVCSKTGP